MIEVLYVGTLSNATDTDPPDDYTETGPSSPALVGPEPILSDGSTSTYAELVQSFTITSSGTRVGTRRDYAKGKLDVLSVDSTEATLNSIRVVLDGAGITWNTDAPPFETADIYDPTSWDSYWGWKTMWNFAGFCDASHDGDSLFAPGAWGSDFRHPETGVSRSPAEVLDFLASGMAYVRTEATGNQSFGKPGDYSVTSRVFEFRVEVDYDLIATVAPPCQLHPRDDDQGAGTAAIWPPPSNSRPGSYY